MVKKRPEVRIDVSMKVQPEPGAVSAAAVDDPFRILVLGDFSGRGSRGLCEPQDLGKRRVRIVDRDNFDDVLAAIAPSLSLPLAASGAALGVAFEELDDFHPDALYRRVDLFDRLRGLRDRLQNPATSAAAIAELTVGQKAPPPAAKPTPQASAPKPPASESDDDAGSLLESALQATESTAPAGEVRSELVDRLVQEYVTPFSIPRPDARIDDLVADVERAVTGQMRALLGASEFQQLEATWRSLYLLVRRLETDRKLQIHILDVTRDELHAALAGGEGPLDSGLARHLVDRAGDTAGGVPYAVVVGDFALDANMADVALLDGMATICARAGSAFLTGANPQWVGCPGFGLADDPDDWNGELDDAVSKAWGELRSRPEAAAVGMVMPRFLLRQPYGARSSPVTSFPFEEISEEQGHEELLWGSGAFLVTLLLAQNWRQDGWQMQLLDRTEVAGIPVHLRRVDGEAEAVPGAEIELTSRGAERIGSLGFMPLFSVRGTDSVRLGALRSVAAGGAAKLRGRWGSR